MAEPKRHNPGIVDERLNRPAGTTAADPDGIASILRDARMKLGVDLRDVADALRIQHAYLRAIEDAKYSELPGPTYALGFVRTYAEYLNLDSREIVRRFKEESRGMSRRQALVFPEPLQEGRFPGGTLLIAALVLAVGVYIGWNSWQQKHTAQIDTAVPPPSNLVSGNAPASSTPQLAPSPMPSTPAPTPSEAQASSPSPTSSDTTAPGPNGTGTINVGSTAPGTAAPTEPPPSPVAIQTAPTGSAPDVASSEVGPIVPTPAPKPADISARSAASGTTSQPSATSAASTPPPADETMTNSPPPAEQIASVKPAEPHVYGETNTASRITLTARQESWVQVRDRDSNVVWTRMMRAGDSYKVPNQPGLTLLTGNAGALEVWVDGRSAPSLGPEGAVRRNIALDPDKIATGTAGSQ